MHRRTKHSRTCVVIRCARDHARAQSTCRPKYFVKFLMHREHQHMTQHEHDMQLLAASLHVRCHTGTVGLAL